MVSVNNPIFPQHVRAWSNETKSVVSEIGHGTHICKCVEESKITICMKKRIMISAITGGRRWWDGLGVRSRRDTPFAKYVNLCEYNLENWFGFRRPVGGPGPRWQFFVGTAHTSNENWLPTIRRCGFV